MLKRRCDMTSLRHWYNIVLRLYAHCVRVCVREREREGGDVQLCNIVYLET